jgi:hypothetical protein
VILQLVPVTLTDAKRLVNDHHEHNETTARQTWKFGTGVAADGDLVGVAMVGRPTGRRIDQYLDVEITRVYTYTLASEDAASVRAAGFVLDAVLPITGSWSTPSRPRYDETLFGPRKRPREEEKFRWRRDLRRRS